MTSDPVAPLTATLAAARRLVAGVRPDQWQSPTPCEGWDVRDVIRHVVEGNLFFTALLEGAGSPGEARAAVAAAGDPLGDDPAGAFAASGDAVVAAFRGPGALERSVSVPIGDVPGAVALHLRLTEFLVHGWDVAQATGQRPGFDDAVVEQALATSRRVLTSLPQRPPVFAAEQPVDDAAPALDRLAALLGRRVPA